jgi:hypothetical protein
MTAIWDNVHLIAGRPASSLEIYNAVGSHRLDHVSLMHGGVLLPIEQKRYLEREFLNFYVPLTKRYSTDIGCVSTAQRRLLLPI